MVDVVNKLGAGQPITPSIPAPGLTYSGTLPKPEEVVASAYDFAEQQLTSQRKFAENVIEATGRCLAPTKARRPRRATPGNIPHARRAGIPLAPGSTICRLDGFESARGLSSGLIHLRSEPCGARNLSTLSQVADCGARS